MEKIKRSKMLQQSSKTRCTWSTSDAVYIRYHDEEWGTPVHNDRKLFEMLILEGAQAGLSWITILKRRTNYRKAFDNFNATKIAGYDRKRIRELLKDPGIIRNRLKIEAAISNAKAFLEVQKEFGTFDTYILRFSRPVSVSPKTSSDIPVTTDEADAMSKDLKKRGFKFVGPTICYAFMQAVGLVNDHTKDCFRYKK